MKLFLNFVRWLENYGERKALKTIAEVQSMIVRLPEDWCSYPITNPITKWTVGNIAVGLKRSAELLSLSEYAVINRVVNGLPDSITDEQRQNVRRNLKEVMGLK